MLNFIKKILNPMREQKPVTQVDVTEEVSIDQQSTEIIDEEQEEEIVEVLEEKAGAAPKPRSTVWPDNEPMLHQYIIDAITGALKPLRGNRDLKGVKVHVDDPVIAMAIDTPTFKEKLHTAFDNNLLPGLGKGPITIVPSLTDEAMAITLCDGHLQLVLQRSAVASAATQPAAEQHGKAVVSIVEGTGSLAKEAYTLDAAVKTTYHIGRGVKVHRNGKLRINDIVIRENETDAELRAFNNRVSSSHADIICRDGAFYLKAMPGGCRPEGGSATKIVRGEQLNELRSLTTGIMLQDGDFIELGGQLLLAFGLLPD